MKLTWNGELTPKQEKLSLLSGVAIAIVGVGIYKSISYYRSKRTSQRIKEYRKELDIRNGIELSNLKHYLNRRLQDHRRIGEEIVRKATGKPYWYADIEGEITK